ncbi:MAG: hypothetical protein P8I04_15805 [Algibacter sp.]|nr:hypothetical protein [Algibacter sp.]MDG1731314.1 hypothetical protein [Algibacter sp.]
MIETITDDNCFSIKQKFMDFKIIQLIIVVLVVAGFAYDAIMGNKLD